MRILFDQGTPVPLRQFLTHHEIITAYECGWSKLKNGELLNAAENAGFELVAITFYIALEIDFYPLGC